MNESGSMYPNSRNMSTWDGVALKDIRAQIAKYCIQDINSLDPNVQNEALNKCYGMKVPDRASDFLPCAAKSGVALRAGKTPEELAQEALINQQASAASAAASAAATAAQNAKAAVDAASS